MQRLNHKNSEFYKLYLKEPRLLPILIQRIGKVLKEIHSKGIIHGNLRPSNILIKMNPKVLESLDEKYSDDGQEASFEELQSVF